MPFENDTANAVLIVMALLLVARWLVADKKWPRWVPRIIKGGKREDRL